MSFWRPVAFVIFVALLQTLYKIVAFALVVDPPTEMCLFAPIRLPCSSDGVLFFSSCKSFQRGDANAMKGDIIQRGRYRSLRPYLASRKRSTSVRRGVLRLRRRADHSISFYVIHFLTEAALYLFVEKFLGLVDLGRQIRAAASIGVVEQHGGSVSLADLVLGDGALAAGNC